MTDNIIAIGDGTERKSTMIHHSQPNKNHDSASDVIQPYPHQIQAISPTDTGSELKCIDGAKSGKGRSDADIPEEWTHLKAQQSGLDSWCARAATSQEACDATHRSLDSAADKDSDAGPSAGVLAAAEDDCLTVDSIDGCKKGPEPVSQLSLLKKKYNIPSVDSLNINENDRSWIKIVMIIRNDMRNYFGLPFTNRCGFFTDYHMSTLIHQYYCWLDYPKGYHKIRNRGSTMQTAAVSTDGYYLFTGSMKYLYKWNMCDHSLINSWTETTFRLSCLIYHKRRRLISGDYEGIIRVRNAMKNDELIHTLKGHTNFVYSMDVNLDGTLLVSGSRDRSIRLWLLTTGECLRVIADDTHIVRFIHFINDSHFISASSDKSIRIWHPYIEECQQMMTDDNLEFFKHASINQDASILACAGYYNLSLYSLPNMQLIRVIPERTKLCEFHPVNPDLLAVYSKCTGYSLKILNVSSGDITDISDRDITKAQSLCFSPDGSRLICANFTDCVHIWDVSDLN